MGNHHVWMAGLLHVTRFGHDCGEFTLPAECQGSIGSGSGVLENKGETSDEVASWRAPSCHVEEITSEKSWQLHQLTHTRSVHRCS